MVYIRLEEKLFKQIGQLFQADKIVRCGKQTYASYLEFKRVAQHYKLQIHKNVARNDIVTYAQMDRLLQRQKQTPEQRRLIEELKSKHQRRLLSSMNTKKDKAGYYNEKPQAGNGVKQMTDSISFAMTFIFSFFLAGLTGYYFGQYFLSLDFAKSLMVSIVFIIVTIVVQTSLFIIKQTKGQGKNPQARTYKPAVSLASKSSQNSSERKTSKDKRV